jgi:flagellar hook-basal body complex protein FliE
MKIGQGLSLEPRLEGMGKRSKIDSRLDDAQTSFGETLSKAIGDVNNLQNEAGRAVERMVGGEEVDLHDVMVAVEKAKTSFDLLMEIRNKTIEAYREIMRMQV